ncbi:hypothetical protein PSPO01_05879 [Paraphaeosphaeria sporulosa]
MASSTSPSTSTPATLSVSFPSLHPTTGLPITFNKDYYFNVHIAKFAQTCIPFGYLDYQFFEFPNPSPFTGEPPEYAFQTVGYLETREGLQKAVEATKEEAMRDLKEFVDLGEGVGPAVVVGIKSEEKWFGKGGS